MSIDFNAEFWLRPPAEVFADLKAQNPVDYNGEPLSNAAILAVVQSVQNAVTGNVDEGWTQIPAEPTP